MASRLETFVGSGLRFPFELGLPVEAAADQHDRGETQQLLAALGHANLFCKPHTTRSAEPYAFGPQSLNQLAHFKLQLPCR